MTDQKKTTKPRKVACKELQDWITNVYTPWYEQKTGVHTTDDGNPDLPPPPPPGHGK